MNDGSFLNLNKYIFKKIEIKSNIQPKRSIQNIYQSQSFGNLSNRNTTAVPARISNITVDESKVHIPPQSQIKDKENKIFLLEKEVKRLKSNMIDKEFKIKETQIENKKLKFEIKKIKKISSANKKIQKINYVSFPKINGNVPEPTEPTEPTELPELFEMNNEEIPSPFTITLEHSISTAPQEIDPDDMTYEQLLELQDKIGYVSRGFSEAQVNRIPVVNYTSKISQEFIQGDKICTICQYDYKPNDQLRQFICNHAFHVDCVDNWLRKEKICPNCKEEIVIMDSN